MCVVRRTRILIALTLFLCAGNVSRAQISFTTAVALALQNSLRVKAAQDDIRKANAVLSEATNVYIPSVSASSGLGASSGITLSVPTIFTIGAQSLAFSYSQPDYIRAARLGVVASQKALAEVQQEVEEDTAVTYVSLDMASLRQVGMTDEYRFALKLVSIVQDRLTAGVESQLELKKAQRTAVQIRLQQLQMDNQIGSLQDHLARLIGLPDIPLETVPDSVPSIPTLPSSMSDSSYADTPDISSAEANVSAKLEQARGDSRYTWRPQLMIQAQYGRISPFNNVSSYYNLNGDYNTLAVGVQIQLPFLDRGRKARANQSMSDSQHAQHEATYLREQQSESRLKLRHSLAELTTKTELAELEQGIAQDQLSAILVQSAYGTGNNSAPLMTPKDEQNARIQERQKYLELLDTKLQLRQAQISLLRQTGALEDWIRSSPNALASTPKTP